MRYVQKIVRLSVNGNFKHLLFLILTSNVRFYVVEMGSLFPMNFKRGFQILTKNNVILEL